MPAPPPSSEEHRKLLDLARRRLRSSEDTLSARHEKWRRSERTYRLFVDPSEVQNTSDATSTDPELLHPYPTSIVIPLSYALTQTLVSFWLTLFTSNRPYFTIDPADQNSAAAAKSQELLLTYQLDRMGWVPILYQWLLDSTRYGLGIVSNTWEVMHKIQTVRRNFTMPGPMGPISIPITTQQNVLDYEGNMMDIVDPFCWRPDPRWPVVKFQRGSFCGEELWRSRFELKRKMAEGVYSNVDEISHYTAEHMKEDASDRDRISGMSTRYGFSIDDPNDAMTLVEPLTLDLIPADYDLSPSDQPERWLLVVANRSVVIRVEPYPYDHQEYNYCTMESSMDLHSLANPGLIEIMEPIHQHVSWFINCYSSDTEILTERGWVPFPDILETDQVATIDPEDRKMWYETPKAIYHLPYTGDMVELANSGRHDLLTTPNHRMWVHTRKDEAFRFVTASTCIETKSRFYFTNRIEWEGQNIGDLVFNDRSGAPTIVSEEWLAEFLGWFVSEGSAYISTDTYGVSIDQKKPEGIALLDQLYATCPFSVTRSVSATGTVKWCIYHKDFCLWLREFFGHSAGTKHLPDFVRNWDKDSLLVFLRAAIAGDGQQATQTAYSYTTISKQLADDLQECCVKIGWRASKSLRPQLTSAGKEVYDLWIETENTDTGLEGGPAGSFRYVPSDGMVHCVENSTHLIVVRRNGKVTICAQSMIENARKSLNDRVIYDPSIVNMDDVMNPSAGKAIRLNFDYWGIPGAVDQGARQLKVEDVSRQNMQHVSFLVDLLQRVAAANETLQGQPTQEEKTATEISSMATQGSARLRTQAKLFSATGLVPLARQMVQNNQQLMSQPTYLKVMGSLATQYPGVGAEGGVSIAPEDIQGLFQFPISDASAPLDPVRFARTWVQIMQMSIQNPALAPRVNHLAVWAETMKAMGINDPSRFILPQQVQVMPDQQLQQQVQAGNLVPQQGGPQQQPGGAPPPRLPIPARPQPQSLNGEEHRPR